MKYFIHLFLLCFSASAFPLDSTSVDSAGFKKLTEQQKAEVIKSIADKAAQGEMTTAKQANEWLEFGQKIGQGLAGTARELGVAVNDFAQTPMGQLAVFLLVWHFMGGMAIHVIFGVTFFFVGLIGIRYLVGISKTKVITYDKEKQDIFGRNRVLSVEVGKTSDEESWIIFWLTIINIAVSLTIIFTW